MKWTRMTELAQPGLVVELEGVGIPAAGMPSVSVVRGVNWQVEEGQRWLVRGAARSGKSSVIGVAAGLIRPVTGRHRLFGADLVELGEAERTALRRRVGVVFGEGGRLFSSMTVLQNLALPLQYHLGSVGQEEAARIARLIEGLGLERYAKWMPGDLPRSVAQRVALARALVLSPSILLLDEPTLGLSLEEVGWWRRFVGGGAAEVMGSEKAPATWVVATSEGWEWGEWSGETAWVEGGKWRVEAAGEELRLAAGG